MHCVVCVSQCVCVRVCVCVRERPERALRCVMSEEEVHKMISSGQDGGATHGMVKDSVFIEY